MQLHFRLLCPSSTANYRNYQLSKYSIIIIRISSLSLSICRLCAAKLSLWHLRNLTGMLTRQSAVFGPHHIRPDLERAYSAVWEMHVLQRHRAFVFAASQTAHASTEVSKEDGNSLLSNNKSGASSSSGGSIDGNNNSSDNKTSVKAQGNEKEKRGKSKKKGKRKEEDQLSQFHIVVGSQTPRRYD